MACKNENGKHNCRLALLFSHHNGARSEGLLHLSFHFDSHYSFPLGFIQFHQGAFADRYTHSHTRQFKNIISNRINQILGRINESLIF